MIQRIQSLYLFVAAVLMGLMLAMPLIRFTGINATESEEFVLTACSFNSAAPTVEPVALDASELAAGFDASEPEAGFAAEHDMAFDAAAELGVEPAAVIAVDPATAAAEESISYGNTLAMGIVIIVAALLPLIIIFLYKRRPLQYRLCVSEIVLLVGVIVFLGFFIFRAMVSLEGYDDSMFTFCPAAFFPIAALLLVWLAMRGILKDARLIRSLDRIR